MEQQQTKEEEEEKEKEKEEFLVKTKQLEVTIGTIQILGDCALAKLHLRFSRLQPQPDANTVLGIREVSTFFNEVEGRFLPRIQEIMSVAFPDIKVSVSCSDARIGSLEFYFFIFATTYAAPTIVGGVHKFIIDYPKFREGLIAIAKDIEASVVWLEDRALGCFSKLTKSKMATRLDAAFSQLEASKKELLERIKKTGEAQEVEEEEEEEEVEEEEEKKGRDRD